MLPRLAELNTYVPVHDLGGKAGDDITIDLIQGFHVSSVTIPDFYFLPL
jgi:ubiquitin-activating enzyme E1